MNVCQWQCCVLCSFLASKFALLRQKSLTADSRHQASPLSDEKRCPVLWRPYGPGVETSTFKLWWIRRRASWSRNLLRHRGEINGDIHHSNFEPFSVFKLAWMRILPETDVFFWLRFAIIMIVDVTNCGCMWLNHIMVRVSKILKNIFLWRLSGPWVSKYHVLSTMLPRIAFSNSLWLVSPPQHCLTQVFVSPSWW